MLVSVCSDILIFCNLLFCCYGVTGMIAFVVRWQDSSTVRVVASECRFRQCPSEKRIVLGWRAAYRPVRTSARGAEGPPDLPYLPHLKSHPSRCPRHYLQFSVRRHTPLCAGSGRRRTRPYVHAPVTKQL